MSAILHAAPRNPEPVELLKAAIAWAKSAGIRVRIGSFGVSVASTHGPKRWERDPLERDVGVDPLGALILLHQPPAMDPTEAAAQALGMDAMWAEGLAAGLGLEPKDSRWMQSRRRHYFMHAYETGVTLRIHVLSFGAQS